MRECQTKRLGDFVDLISGFAFKSSQFGNKGELPLIRIRDLADGKSTTFYSGEYEAKYVVNNGDILVSMDGEFRVNTWSGGKALLNQRVCKLVPKQGLNPRFLMHFLPKDLKRIEDQTPFVTVKHLSSKSIRSITIPLPPLEEQVRIAAILDKAEAIRRKREEAMNLADDLTTSTFRKTIGAACGKTANIGDVALGAHIEFLTSGSRGWAKYYTKSGPRFIRSNDVRMNRLDFSDPVHVDPPQGAERNRTRVRAGDVLLTITGSRIGRVSWVPEGIGEAYISQHVAIIRLGDRFLPEFVSFFLSDRSLGQLQIRKLQYGQTKPGLNLDQIRNFQVPQISPSAQQDILKSLSKIRSISEDYQNALNSCDNLFNSISQRAFRGEL